MLADGFVHGSRPAEEPGAVYALHGRLVLRAGRRDVRPAHAGAEVRHRRLLRRQPAERVRGNTPRRPRSGPVSHTRSRRSMMVSGSHAAD